MKNILFDFGNVFVDLDFEQVDMGIQTYLGMTLKGLYARYKEVFDGFETGHLSEKAFVESVAKMGLPSNKVKGIWNSMLVGMPKSRLDFLASLQGQYKLYLYSNINSFHEKELDRMFQEAHGLGLLDFRSRYFDGTWFSHHIGFRKPGKEGFELIVKETGIVPEETLFIDDSADYLNGAKAVGMHTQLHNPANDIADVFHSYLEAIS